MLLEKIRTHPLFNVGDHENRGGAAGFLRPIDTERIVKTLDLESKGRENGSNNIPAETSKLLDAVEQSVVQRIESEWSWHRNELLNQLRAYATRLIGYSVDAEFQRLRLKGCDALASLRSAHHTADEELGHLRDSYVETRNEFQQFKRKHHLERPARNQAGRWTTWGLLIVLAAIEAVLNGVFFAKGSEFGLVGGIGTAIGISLTNIIIAFLLGLGPARWIHHRSYFLKVFGVAFVATGMSFLLGLHFFAVHLREAIAGGGEATAMLSALENIMREPWKLSDLSSIYLFSLGVLFAFAAFWKGYSFDDPYPGYGAHSRRFRTAREAYADEHSSVFDDLEDIKVEAIEALDNGMKKMPLFPQQASKIRKERSALVESFSNYEGALETAANKLLAQYRQANQKSRTEPEPKHFDEYWRLPHSMIDEDNVKSLLSDSSEPDRQLDAALEELGQLANDVLAEYEKLIAKYPHTGQIK